MSQEFHSGQLHRFNDKAQKQHDIQKFLGFLGVRLVGNTNDELFVRSQVYYRKQECPLNPKFANSGALVLKSDSLPTSQYQGHFGDILAP